LKTTRQIIAWVAARAIERYPHRVIEALGEDPRAPLAKLVNAVLNKPIGLRAFTDALELRQQNHPDELLEIFSMIEHDAAKSPALLNGVLDALLPHRDVAKVLMERVSSNPMYTDALLESVLKDHALPRISGEFGRMLAIADLHTLWGKTKAVLNTAAPGVHAKWKLACSQTLLRSEVRDVFLGVFSEEGKLYLRAAAWEFPDRRSMWCLLNEILLEEEYYFESDRAAPRIIDAGTHCGLAIYYFKIHFPDSQVTAFEPVPYLHEMAMRNVSEAGFEGVELLPFALAASEGIQEFFLPSEDSMAGSLAKLPSARRRSGSTMHIKTVRLSAYLNAPVDMLKMDIEGAELEVLRESQELLGNVHHIFCELHVRPGAASIFGELVTLLEKAGHEVRAAQSWAERQYHVQRPLTHMQEADSMILWTTNRNWPPNPGECNPD